MSIVGGPLVMTITDRQKCFEERKQLASHPCSVNHYITLGMDIDNGALLSPDNSPSAISPNPYQESMHSHSSNESLTPPTAPPTHQPAVRRCSVLTMGPTPTSPATSDHEQGSYIHQTVYSGQVDSSPLQLGSPYSSASSPESHMYSSPNQFDATPPPPPPPALQMMPSHHHHHHHQPTIQMGSPQQYHPPSPYKQEVHSPSEFTQQDYAQSNGSPPYHPVMPPLTSASNVPHLLQFSTPCTTTGGVPAAFFDSVTGEPAIYTTMPGTHPQMIESFHTQAHHLPPFAHVFEGSLSPEPPQNSPPLVIKHVRNDFSVAGIDYYHSSPAMLEGHSGMIFSHPDMCSGASPLPAELCSGLQPLPSHLCPMPTLQKRKPKQQKRVPPIEVDDSDIKDIPTSAQLWEFTLRVLKKPKYKYMVSWEKREEGLFRFNNAQAFAALWGKHRNRPHMSYDKVARALRYYYKRNILEQVGGRLTYRFSKRLSKLYMSDV